MKMLMLVISLSAMLGIAVLLRGALSDAAHAQQGGQALETCKKGIVPNGDGDGDGAADDRKVHTQTHNNTIVQVWCIDGGAAGGGFFYAMLIAGVPGVPFRYVSKCVWKIAKNTLSKSEDAAGNLTRTIWTSTNDKPGGNGEKVRYTYDHAGNVVKIQRLDKDNKPLGSEGTQSPAPEPPYNYGDLPTQGGGDVSFESDDTEVCPLVLVESVGGTGEFLNGGSDTLADPAASSSSRNYAAPIAASIAGAAFVLATGGWYARRQWMR